MNKFADDFDFYRSCVDQDERVLWKGKPGKGRTLGSNGERFIVFGRFWLDWEDIGSAIFAIFWWSLCLMRMRKETDFSLSMLLVWGIPVIVGLCLVVGKLIRKAYLRTRTFYVVTNKKLIIKSGRRLKMYEKQMMPPMQVKCDGDGHGTIFFFGKGYNRTGVRRLMCFALENLENVKQAQEALAMME